MSCCHTIKHRGMNVRVRPTLETWVEHLNEVSEVPPEELAAWAATARREMQEHLSRLEAEAQRKF
jgi:hypothetical protein